MTTLWSGNATVDQIQNCPVRIVENDQHLRFEAAYDGNSSYSEVTTPIEARTLNPQPDQSLIQRLTNEHLITQTQTAGAGTSSGGGDSGRQTTGMGFNSR